MNRNIQDARKNINLNIDTMLESKELTQAEKTRVMNAIDTAVFEAIDENCELPE